MEFDSLKKILAAISVSISLIPLLSGCLTYSLWDQGIVHRIPDRKITVSENEVRFQAKETIRYPFLPFHRTTEQNHDRRFTAKSGALSEWSIETDPQAPRFSRKFGLPIYSLPDKKSTLLRPGDQMPDSTFRVRQTHLKIHPDDIPLLRKPFLFRGYSIDGKRLMTLQIPVSFQSGKLKCCLPEGAEIVTQDEFFWETLRGLPLAWNCLWTPLTVVCDIVTFPAYLIIQGYFK